MLKFGVAGFPPNFTKSEYKSKRENVFKWINSLGLEWIELQNTYGIKMPDEQANMYRSLGEQFNVGISIHAPYYITLASDDMDVIRRSQERIIQAYALAEKLNSKRIIFHPGHYSDKTIEGREKALLKLIQALKEIQNDIPLNKGIYLYAETIGKKSQLGSVDEIIEICREVDYCLPCLDLAHVHAFEQGSLYTSEAIYNLLSYVKKSLGKKIDNKWHFHMYPVDYDKNGERGHKAFADRRENVQLNMFDKYVDDKYHPTVQNFINAVKQIDISGVVVCEAKDSQDVGAKMLKQHYEVKS